MKHTTSSPRAYTVAGLQAFLAEIKTVAADSPVLSTQELSYSDAALFVENRTALIVGNPNEANEMARDIRAILIERVNTFDGISAAYSDAHRKQFHKERADHYNAILIMLALYR